jgi:ABC-2 type transport system permease protein
MNKRQFFELCKINLLYANPPATNKARKKGKTGQEVVRSVLLQYLVLAVIFIFVYGFSMVLVDFSKRPGYFTYYVALFTILGLTQSMSSIYNVFFQSKDMKDYLPLPFKSSDVFFAKFVVVALTVIPFLLPALAAMVLAGVKSQLGLVSIPVAIVVFVLFFVLLFGLATLLIFGMTKFPFYQKNQNLFKSLILYIPYIVMFGAIFMLSYSNGSSASSGQSDRPIIALFLPFHTIMTNLFSPNGLLSFGGLVVLTAIVVLAVVKFIIPSLFDNAIWITQNTGHKKAHGHRNLTQTLKSYNLSLVKEPTLIMQSISSSIIAPVILIITGLVAVRRLIPKEGLPVSLLGVFFLAGIVFALMTINQTSFVANLISLDRENFIFIRSLPISMRHYLRNKFKLGLMLQLIICEIILIAASLVLGVSLPLALSLYLGGAWGCYFSSQFYYARDYRLLSLNWTNISQLFTRGAGNFGLMFAMFGTMILGTVLVAAYAAVVLLFPIALFVNLAFFIIVIGLSILLWQLFTTKFWRKLQD